MKSSFVEQNNEFFESCIAGDERTEERKLVMKRRQRKKQFLKKSQRLNNKALHYFRCLIRV